MTTLIQHLTSSGFKIKQDVVYRHSTFAYVAKRTKRRPWLTSAEEIFVIIAHFSSLDTMCLKEFATDCRRYSYRHRLIPFLPLTGGALCYPVAISHEVDQKELQSFLETNPKVGIGYMEVPAIVDLTNRRISYSKKTPSLGWLALPYAREKLNDLLQRWDDCGYEGEYKGSLIDCETAENPKRTCPHCDKTISDKSVYCPYCGIELN